MVNYDHIIVRYGEITLKGKNRGQFVKQLRKNVKHALKGFPAVEIDAHYERMVLTLHGEDYHAVVAAVRQIFGVLSLTPALKTTPDLDAIKATALGYARVLGDQIKTFKVETKRADKNFPLDSVACSREVGAHLLIHRQPLTVDVHNPDLRLLVEIKTDAAYISGKTEKAVGGLPIGTGGRAMLMLSGGIDSPVAGYMVMKRGVEIECVHFESPPYTSSRARQKVIDLAEVLSHQNGKMVLHIVPFTEIQKQINDCIPDRYSITVMRRIMIRIVEAIRTKREAMAIVTGDNLGQVASQTLESMYTINEVTNTPILRPLISMDKNDIIAIAKDLDTYDISIRPYEDCCTIFKPSSPKTKPRREKVHQFEDAFDFAPMIAKAVEDTEKLVFSNRTKKEDAFDKLF